MADNISTKIKCDGCNKNLMAMRFSESSKRKWQESIRANRRNPKISIKLPRCVDCTSQSRQEMKCVMCGLVKSLDKFSKKQRQNTDDAHCWDCSQEKQDREADHEKEIQEVEIIAEEKLRRLGINGSSTYSATGTRLGGSRVSRSDVSRAQSERFETDTNPASENWVSGNDAISYDGSAYSDSLSQSSRPTTRTGWDNFRDGDNVRQNSKTGSQRDRGWVKQGAVPQNPRDKAINQLHREDDREREAEDNPTMASDDEDDDEDDDPY